MLKKIKTFIKSEQFAIYFGIFALVYITYIKPTL